MPVARRANTYGALDMGLAPTLLPGRVAIEDAAGRSALEDHWGPLPDLPGWDTTGILEGLRDGDIKALVLHGADPIRDHPSPELAAAALDAAEYVVAFDIFLSDTSSLADVVLPVEAFGEVQGTATNLEGRVQKLNRLMTGPGQSRPTWAVLDDLARRMGAGLDIVSAEALSKEIATVAPAYAGISWDLLDWGEGREGVVLPGPDGTQPLRHAPTDLGLIAGGGRYGLHLVRELYDDGVRTRMSPAIAGLARTPLVGMNPRDAGSLAVSEGQIVRIEAENDGGGAIELPVRFDPDLVSGTITVPANLPATSPLGAPASVSVHALRQDGDD
jgi:predicted molibdopterin-dependent oxidoreductase YjgC